MLSGLCGTLDGKAIDGEFMPINNMVLVKLADLQQETAAGLVLTAKKKVKKNEGTVVSTGTGKIHHESGIAFDMPVSAGDNVLYNEYGGTDLDYNGVKHSLIPDDDIIVKYTGEALNLENAEVLRDNVLVSTPKDEEVESMGGILLAKSTAAKQGKTVGEVVKVGPGRYASNGVLMEMDIETGDMVKFNMGRPVEIDGEAYTVVRMRDVLCKF